MSEPAAAQCFSQEAFTSLSFSKWVKEKFWSAHFNSPFVTWSKRYVAMIRKYFFYTTGSAMHRLLSRRSVEWQQFPSLFQESCIMVCTLPRFSIFMSSCMESSSFWQLREPHFSILFISFIDEKHKKNHKISITFLDSDWQSPWRWKNSPWTQFLLIFRPCVQQDVWQLRLLARWSPQHHRRRAVSVVSSLAQSRSEIWGCNYALNPLSC